MSNIVDFYNPTEDALKAILWGGGFDKLVKQGSDMGLTYLETLNYGAYLIDTGFLRVRSDNKLEILRLGS